ncbi:MAG: hypothetical protein JJE13_09315 [Thermoleophilia bacterium]|nr:hypothetical protein [Thermoleophilia bacterium]
MKPTSGPLFRGALFVILALLIPAGLTACGGSDDSDDPQTLSFTASSEDAGVKVSGPSTAESGPTEISLQNDAKDEGDLQLVKVADDQTIEETIKGIDNWFKGQPLPDWISFPGGVGTTPAGESQTVTQVLEPGTYYGFGTEGDPTAELAATFKVTGDSSDDSVEADESVSAFDYGFKTEGLKTGENEVLFENTGQQPHHMIYAPIVGDATLDDVKTALKEEEGPPPVDEKQTKSTAVLEGGDSQVVKLDFAKPGRYALICFISDRDGGPPHALKGMVAEVDVK